MYSNYSDVQFPSLHNEEPMNLRQFEGLKLAASQEIVYNNGRWRVPSRSGGRHHWVDFRSAIPTCDCDDYQLRQEECAHIYAVVYTAKRQKQQPIPELDATTIPKKPTYKQNWAAYNEAQMTEKPRFYALLADLVSGVEEPEAERGRPPVPVKDNAFTVVAKVFSTWAARRFVSDLDGAVDKGYLSRYPHANSISTVLRQKEMTPILKELVVRSSLPMRAIETDFATDSSGFSSSRYVRWFDEKYGVKKSGHDWVKVHIAVGVKTQIVTAVEIRGRDANDAPMFGPLIEVTARNFKINEVSGDKAYSSVENLELVAGLGGTAYIPFKSNATGGSGGLWERMYHYFQFNRKEFLEKYHKRSKVESAFAMVKAKFGTHVRSRTDTSMKNEVLAKFIAHNILVVHQAQIELGVEAMFWGDEKDKKSDGGATMGLPPAI